jgi:hypothetical protein
LPVRLEETDASMRSGSTPTSGVQSTTWSKDLRVTADGAQVVSHVGAALLRMLADRVGLTGALFAGLARTGTFPFHDRK